MRILFIPHCPTTASGWEDSLHYHLFRHFSKHHDIHWVSWKNIRSFQELRGLASIQTQTVERGIEHRILLPRNLYGLFVTYPKPAHVAITQWWFRRQLRKLYRAIAPDILVMCDSYYATGFPSFDSSRRTVFDHLDLAPKWVANRFIEEATSVIAITNDVAQTVNPGRTCTIIPNGVDVASYAELDKSAAKEELGLGGQP
jgi:hypothetical protein